MKLSVVQFIRFSMVGLINTALGLSTIFALMYLVELPPVLANTCGYAVGLCFSFFANGKWTFRRSVSAKLAVRFLLAFAVCYGANLIVLLAFIDWAGVVPWVAQICAVGTYTVLFFCLSKFYVYREPDMIACGAAK